jgi:transcriptional regulator with XRE-family HTH domain
MSYQMMEQLRLAIARKGSQKAVAFALEMSEAELSRILNGDRGMSIIIWQKLFDHLNLTLAESENNDDRELIRLMSKKLSEEMK